MGMVEILKYMCIPLEKLHNLFPIMLCYSPYITHDAPTRDGNKKKWSWVGAKKTNGRQPTQGKGRPRHSRIYTILLYFRYL